MTRHVILWKLKKDYTPEELASIKDQIKTQLEGLLGQIPGLLSIKVQSEALPSSTADLMLDATFESAEALSHYATHPAHVAVANRYVRPFTAERSCLDFELGDKTTI